MIDFDDFVDSTGFYYLSFPYNMVRKDKDYSDFYPVYLTGEVASIDACRAFGAYMRSLLLNGNKKIIIDWSLVLEISGSLAGFIVVAEGRFKQVGGEIIFANPSERVSEVFDVVGLGGMVVRDLKLPQRNNMCALVVDDDAAVREVTGEYLQEMGYMTISAGDGLSGLVIYKLLNKNIDLTISDIEMPRLDGLDLLKSMQLVSTTCKVVVATGYTDSDKISEFKKICPSLPILHKPYLQSDLEKAIQSISSAIPLPSHR